MACAPGAEGTLGSVPFVPAIEAPSRAPSEPPLKERPNFTFEAEKSGVIIGGVEGLNMLTEPAEIPFAFLLFSPGGVPNELSSPSEDDESSPSESGGGLRRRVDSANGPLYGPARRGAFMGIWEVGC